MNPSAIWPLDPHTRAKHEILEAYLKAWFPILAKYHGKVVYFDGFAGPGEYTDGERGSPIIALEVAKEHHERGTLGADKQILFTFVEKDEARATHLDGLVNGRDWPGNFDMDIENSTFEEILTDRLDGVEGRGIAPVFCFVDPFGVDGLPYELIARLLSNPRCEVLITFMSQPISRFVGMWEDILAKLIGQPDAAERISAAADREAEAVKLYDKSLKRVAKFVRYFEMAGKGDRTIYKLFFATNHPLGHTKMKEAMWKTDDTGNFRFSDGIDPNQRVLFSNPPEVRLAAMLTLRFGESTIGWVDVSEYVSPTVYLEKHARQALRLLEAQGRIKVDALKRGGSKRRKGDFPKGVVIHFPNKED